MFSLKPIFLMVLFSIAIQAARTNDYSSFLSANASMAVVLDHQYMTQRGQNILATFQKILSDIIRENLKNGGINVKYFTWNTVRLKKDFLAAMIVTDCKNTWKFYEATQITSILLIAITDTDCPRLPLDRALMVPIVENIDVFSQMILDTKVQQVLNWKTAILLIDQSMLNENPLLVESVMLENTKNHIKPLSTIVYTIDDNLRSQKKRATIRRILERFAYRPHEHQQFMILSKFYEDIVEIGGQLDMFHIYNQWFLFVIGKTGKEFDIVTVTQNLGEGTNIAFIMNETHPECLFSMNNTISELAMGFVTAISRMINEEQSIYGEISDEEWEAIRFTKQEKQEEILNYMKDYLKANSKSVACARWRIETAITWGKNKEQKKYGFNRLTPGLPIDARNRNFDFLDIGFWSPMIGYVTNEHIFPHTEHFFRNISMTIVTTHNPPWQILKHDSRGFIVEHSGIVMELLKELSHILNFTYVLHEIKVQDEEEGEYYNQTFDLTGSLTHFIPYQVYDLVQGDKIFLAALAATVDEPDKKPFNYTLPISVQKYSFIARRPDEVSRIYLFTAPFTVETWACLFGVLIFTAPVLYCINRLVPLQDLRIKGLCTVKNCFWYIYGALLQQGGIYLPKADSGRLIIGFWWIVVIVIVTTYCGNLVAFLTFPKFQPGLDYLYQLFADSHVDQLGLRNGTLFEKYASLTTREDIRKYMQKASIYSNTQGENINAVEKGNRVNIDWRINLQLIIQNHFEKDKDCKFSLSKEYFLDEQIAMILPKNSPYINLINEKITRLFQMGFIERWHQINLPSMDKCNGRGVLRQITNHKVNLDDMQGCFLVLLFGFSFAFCVTFIEYWYYRLYVQDRIPQKSFTK